MGLSSQVEKPSNSVINAENVIRRVRGIVSGNFLFAELLIKQNSALFLSNQKTYGYAPLAVIVYSGAPEV
jgi:hypothetical protein